MSEHSPKTDLFAQEMAKIGGPAARAAFQFFYDASQKEGFDMIPGYTWDQFEDGVAPFNGLEVSIGDEIVEQAELVPNYTPESTEANGLTDTVPLTDALAGPFVRSLHRQRQRGAVRIIANHPSMATPFAIARSLAAGYQEEYGEDIRPSTNIVVGAYPTVLKYNLELKNGSSLEISPVDFGRMLGNLVLTAPKTANTETEDQAVQDWMRATRANFKLRNREILSEKGNVEIVIPAGRRGRKSRAKVPPYHHVEYLPDSNLDYITDFDIPTFLIGVDDNLLNDADHPGSIVNIQGDSRPYYLRNKKQVIDALKHSAELASHGDTEYRVEGWRDQAMRLTRRAIGRFEQDVE